MNQIASDIILFLSELMEIKQTTKPMSMKKEIEYNMNQGSIRNKKHDMIE